MAKVLEAAGKYLEEHWIELLFAIGSMAFGWFLGVWRSRSKWAKKEFLDRLNISLNIFRDGDLLIRTVSEKACDEVFLSKLATDRLKRAANGTTAENPLLELEKDDYWYYLNAVLNEISEQFALGQIRRDAGADVTVARYAICLTSEAAGTAKTRKIRAMMLRKDLFERIASGEQPNFEHENHKTRWKTLQQIVAAYPKNQHKFMDVEICL